MGFAVFVTKQAFPNEKLADHLAHTLAMDEVKRLLEEATEEGRPLYFPVFYEGWAVHWAMLLIMAALPRFSLPGYAKRVGFGIKVLTRRCSESASPPTEL